MCMSCNKNRGAMLTNNNSSRQSYTPPRRIQGTNVRRVVNGNSGFGAPKVKMSFAKRGG